MARRTTRFGAAVGSALMVAISLGPGRAEAAETLRLSVDWAKLSDLLHDGASLLRRESWEARARAAEALPGVAHDPPSFGVAPHVSLIARDWGGAQLLLGHLTAVDEARPSRSSRMLVTRVRFADGRAGPFVQAGVGQWRGGTELMPALRRDVMGAGQLGAGLEWALAPSAGLALEADYTVVYDEREAVASPERLWSALLAARCAF